MPLSNELKSHYEAVLQHLESERKSTAQQVAAGQARLKELNNSIYTLSRQLNLDVPPSTSSQQFAPQHRPAQKYANTSVRWAILDMLMDSQKAMTTPEIADALLAAGVRTRAANFANNVSAVLSTTMAKDHGEVQQLPDGRWELTEKGKGAIAYIRTTPRFRRACPW